jgi:hypothetical protein
VKGKLLALLVVGFVLSVPALALAADTPTPPDAACKAEYLQLGADAFKAKYGAVEAYGNCLKAHGGTTNAPPPPTTTTPSATGPAAACEAEYKQLGADAFKAKYGADNASLACLKAHGGTPPPPPTTTTPSTTGPEALCKAEYLQLGADAFKAKYGADNASLACIRAHGGTPPAPVTTTPSTNGPEAACKAEYAQIGAAAFQAKYGANEPLGACVKAHAGTTQGSGDKPKASDTKARGAASIAQALCSAEGQSLGRDAFQAKYGKGKDGLAACLKAAKGKAQSILAACKSSTSGDAFKQCVQAALKSARAR